MKIMLIDDEAIAIRNLKNKLYEISAAHQVVGFTEPKDAMQYVKEEEVQVAFVDIEMRGMNGLVLAKKLKETQPNIKIIFVTAFSQYAVEAFTIRATGYLLKPVEIEAIRRELDYAVQEIAVPVNKKKIRVQTFGGFDVFVNEVPLVFKRSKSKELLAYLVDRCGNSVTTREACAVLWEDAPYDIQRKNYFQHLVVEMRKTLEQAGISNMLVKSHNSLAINPNLIDCDSYNFMRGDPVAIHSYRHNYMMCYSWAEFTIGELEPEQKK